MKLWEAEEEEEEELDEGMGMPGAPAGGGGGGKGFCRKDADEVGGVRGLRTDCVQLRKMPQEKNCLGGGFSLG